MARLVLVRHAGAGHVCSGQHVADVLAHPRLILEASHPLAAAHQLQRRLSVEQDARSLQVVVVTGPMQEEPRRVQLAAGRGRYRLLRLQRS